MNIVRAKPMLGLPLGMGQFDPSTGIIADVQLGPQDLTPIDSGTDVLSPYQTYGSPYGDATVPLKAPAPSVSVPQPPSGFSFPSTTVRDLYPQGLPPGPSPRVNVPLDFAHPSSISLWLSNNWPMVFGVGAALLILPDLLGGRRRRR